jgi:F-type H+-transporting ATPase subunit b
MLSRIALRSLVQQNKASVVSVRFTSDQRDLVNFPRRSRPIEKAPVRMGIFPEEWFAAFYSKTGVTGPYMALASIGTFLASKEFFVMEHDFYVGVALALVLGGIVKNAGPGITETVNKTLDEEEAMYRNIRQKEIDQLKHSVAMETTAQANAVAWEDIITAKKEAVGLQLESVYRSRLNDAYSQVKKRLDYQLEVANVMRRMEQKHMVDWIINNVKKSITPAQEAAALKKCIADLKALSA